MTISKHYLFALFLYTEDSQSRREMAKNLREMDLKRAANLKRQAAKAEKRMATGL